MNKDNLWDVFCTEALDQFFINAARKQVREIRARQLREEYERTHRRLTPRQVYERTLAQVVAFETRYALSSDQFLQDFESGVIDEDRSDWIAFYRWRTMAYGLRRMEKEYGFKRPEISTHPHHMHKGPVPAAGEKDRAWPTDIEFVCFETVLRRIRERFFLT